MIEVEVILKGSRATVVDHGYPGRARSKRLIPPARLLWFWSYPVKVDKVTLRQLFALLCRLSKAQLRMLECLTMCNIQPFLDEARRGQRGKKSGLRRLEVQTLVSLDEFGVDVRSEFLGRARAGQERYALELSRVPELLGCEIRIDRQATVTRRRRRKEEEIGSYEYDLSLGEFLTAVFGALAFFGTPRKRDAFAEELAQRVEKSVSEKGIPSKLVMARLRRHVPRGKRTAQPA